MKHFFFYGKHPELSRLHAEDLSRNGYECSQLLQNKHGVPVVVSRHETLDIWKVECGFSTVFFGTKAEALAYCKVRFFDVNGQAV